MSKLIEGVATNISKSFQAAIDKSGYKFMHSSENFNTCNDCFNHPFVTVASDSLDIIMSTVVSMAIGIKWEGDEAVVCHDKNEPLVINWRRQLVHRMTDDGPDYYNMRLTCYTQSQYKANLNCMEANKEHRKKSPSKSNPLTCSDIVYGNLKAEIADGKH